MALTEAKKNEWLKTLRELELLGECESFEEHTAGQSDQRKLFFCSR